jgi:3-hydroxybutyryl-CoA dehydrogenase
VDSAIKNTDPVLLIGDAALIASTAVCLLTAGHYLNVGTPNAAEFNEFLNKHLKAQDKTGVYDNQLVVNNTLTAHHDCKLVIAITHENATAKQALLKDLVAVTTPSAIVAINTESIPLDTLQLGLDNPARLIGLNWTEPVHTSLFLEVISTDINGDAPTEIVALANSYWRKDAYIVKNDGIRSRLISAMAREASYLVDNGYASVEDIDRACRNDAGYYLPFCGNCRYMDLMGTYAYGMVMKDLNSDLSKDTQLPQFMEQVLDAGGEGMQNNKGFYNYTDEEVAKWKEVTEKFGYQIQAIIEKYPFNYNK